MRTVTGPGGQLADELAGLAEGWEHFGNAARRAEALAALAEIRAGAPVAVAGHTAYQVTDQAHAGQRRLTGLSSKVQDIST